jgi:hypothetical protein
MKDIDKLPHWPRGLSRTLAASYVGVSPSEPLSSRTALSETESWCASCRSGDPSGSLRVDADAITPRGTTTGLRRSKTSRRRRTPVTTTMPILVRSFQRSRARQPRNLGETRGLFLEFLPFAKVLRDLRQNFGHRLPDIQLDAIFEMRD